MKTEKRMSVPIKLTDKAFRRFVLIDHIFAVYKVKYNLFFGECSISFKINTCVSLCTIYIIELNTGIKINIKIKTYEERLKNMR